MFFLKSDLKINSSSYCAAAAAGAIPPTLNLTYLLTSDIFLQSATSVYVSTANAPAADHLVVGGYDVSGEVRSDGEPMKEVTFLLYSATVKREVRKCLTNKENEVSSLSPAFKTNFRVSAFAAVSTWAAVTHHPWREQTRGTAP